MSWRTNPSIPLIWRRHFPLWKLCNATITFLFFLAPFHMSTCSQLEGGAILLLWLFMLHILFWFKKCPLCCDNVHRCWSPILTFPWTISHPIPPVCPDIVQGIWWKPEQSLVILYSHCCGHSSHFCFCAVDSNVHPTLLTFEVVLFLQLNAEDKVRYSHSGKQLWCQADGKTWLSG